MTVLLFLSFSFFIKLYQRVKDPELVEGVKDPELVEGGWWTLWERGLQIE